MSRHNYFAILFAIVSCSPQQDQVPTRLPVMTFNAWGGGGNDVGTLDQTVAVIRHADPDMLGMQEVRREAAVCELNNCLLLECACPIRYLFFSRTETNGATVEFSVLSGPLRL